MDTALELLRSAHRLVFGAETMLGSMLIGALLLTVLVYLLTRWPRLP